MTPFNPLAASSDCITQDGFAKLYASKDSSTESSDDNDGIINPTPESMYERLTGKPHDQNNVNFIEANIHAIFQAVQNNDKNSFEQHFNFVSDDPINQFLLLQTAYQIHFDPLDNEDDSDIKKHIKKIFDELLLEYPEINFKELNINELHWDINREYLGATLTAFRNTVGVEFYQDKADLADNWIFDIFNAIEDADIQELRRLLEHAEFGDNQNIQIILDQARILSESFNLKDNIRKQINTIVDDAANLNFSRADLFGPTTLSYCKEKDHQLISHLQEVERQEARSNTTKKLASMLIAKFAFPDPDQLNVSYIRNNFDKMT